MNNYFPTFNKVFIWISRFKKIYLFSILKIAPLLLIIIINGIIEASRSNFVLEGILNMFYAFLISLLIPFLYIYIGYREAISNNSRSFWPIFVTSFIATALAPFMTILLFVIFAILDLFGGLGRGHGDFVSAATFSIAMVFTGLLISGWIGYYFARKKLENIL